MTTAPSGAPFSFKVMKGALVSSIPCKGEHPVAGTTQEVSDADGHWLISRGRAVAWTEANQVDADTRAAKPKATRKKVAK